jgi:hypothetical protein
VWPIATSVTNAAYITLHARRLSNRSLWDAHQDAAVPVEKGPRWTQAYVLHLFALF